jgi:hypothetical protein
MAVDVSKVFVSYAHESDEHKAQVLAFATFLRNVGIEAVLDLWSTDARQDWYAWAIREMTAADFVLVVASERYRATGDGNGPSAVNRGIQSEAALLRELVYADRATWLPKVLPVLLPGHTLDHIPLFLQPHTASHFPVTTFDTTGAEQLLRVVLRQPGYVAPEVNADQPLLPPHADGLTQHTLEQEPAVREGVINQINGTVSGTVIQADTINGNITL